MTQSPLEVANMLKQIMAEHFGGKTDTRFRISRERLAQLAGRKILRSDFLDGLYDECLDQGLILIDLDTFFGVQELHVIEGYRSVPPYIVAKLISAAREEAKS